MTDIQILEKAFEKVKKNGLELNSIVPKLVLKYSNIETVIFDHKFAKAFWGEDETCFHCHGDSKDWIEGTCPECFCNPKYRSKWKFNLQQMVLWEKPLKYLEKFL